MKRKLFAGATVIALVAGGFAMSKNSTGTVLTPIQTENIEALSGYESGLDKCNGCSSKNTRDYCCTLIIDQIRADLFRNP